MCGAICIIFLIITSVLNINFAVSSGCIAVYWLPSFVFQILSLFETMLIADPKLWQMRRVAMNGIGHRSLAKLPSDVAM